MMNKRGQIFLIAAIIITLALVSVTITYNQAKEYTVLTDYQDLSQNYLNEVPKIINYAKYNSLSNADTTGKLDSFSAAYLNTAHQKDPKFGVFYSYKNPDGTLHIVNTLNNRVLKIRVIDSTTHEVVSEREIYGNVQTSGGNCIAGVGCTTSTTDTSNFGGQFNNNVDLKTVGSQGIQVCVDQAGIECTDPIPNVLNLLTNTEIPIPRAITSSADVPNTDKTIEFTLEQA